jgi:formate hydrogenlyase subunit 6/NADH:ubiquinone oxidoreductase subunit I
MTPTAMTNDPSKYPGLHPLPPSFVREFPPVAVVVEEKCIACDRCPPLCFFDAIVMEHRSQHKYKRTAVVVTENCTGCGLCFEACPVDAFEWVPDKTPGAGSSKATGESERDLSA